VLKLVEEGRLSLDAKAYGLLPNVIPPPGTTVVDPRIYDVTVRQLLWHTGGWDRDRAGGFDPMFRSAAAAQAVGVPAPAGAETIMRYMLGFPLDFAPGTRYVYSNFGYAIPGRIIEKVTAQSYEQYVKAAVLTPAGATRMQLGHSLEAGRLPEEVRYYDPNTGPSVFPGGGTVPATYGGFYLEAMDAHGGWVASAVDLLRFLTAVDWLPTRSDVLTPASIQLMTGRPPVIWDASPWHYGMGWAVRPAEGNWWHAGSLPGTATILVRTGTGLAWAAVFNARSVSSNSGFEGQLDAKLWEAVQGVTAWPTQDLFGTVQ
jgi:CubicO group peptidase (beta-lactamase class C family)